MSGPAVHLPILTALFALFTSPAIGGPPERGLVPHLVDLYGDPLPDGAVARLGSVRLRHAGLRDFALLPDGKTVVTVADDQMIRWWDLETGRQTRAQPFRVKGSWAMALSPDGSRLAVNESHGESHLVILDTQSGRVVRTVPVPYGLTEGLVFSGDGTALAFGAKGSLLTRVIVRTGRSNEVELGTPHDQHFGPFLPRLDLSFSPDGKRLVAGGIHGGRHTAAVIDVADMAVVFSAPVPAQAQALSPDGNRFIACAEWTADAKAGSSLREYDLKTGKEARRLSVDIEGRCNHVEFSADGKSLVCADWFVVKVLETATGRVRLQVPNSGRTRMSDDGRLLAVQDGPRLRVWDVATGRELHDRPGRLHTGSVAVSRDGRLAASEDESNNAIDIWQAASGRHLRRLAVGEKRGLSTRLCPLEDMAFSDDSERLIVCDARDKVRSWDLTTGRVTAPVTLPDSDHVNYAERTVWFQVAPGGRHVAGVLKKWAEIGKPPSGRTLSVWEAETGKRLVHRPVDDGLYRGCVWSPTGSPLGLLGSDRLDLVDPATGREWHRLPIGGFGSFSADGRLLVCWKGQAKKGEEHHVCVWEVASGRQVALLSQIPGSASRLGVATSARAVVAADARCLRVYDLATGQQRGRWALPELSPPGSTDSPAREIRALPDDRHVLTALADGTALVWDLSAFPPHQLAKNHGESELTAWWEELAGDNATRAYAAGWKLAEAPPGVLIPFLRERLRPARAPDPGDVRLLVADLDSPTFVAREAAARRLGQLGPAVLPAVQQALKQTKSAEARERLEKLLGRLSAPVPPPESLRAIRAVAVLERVGTADARRVLEDLARGADAAPETRAARAALGRLSHGWGR